MKKGVVVIILLLMIIPITYSFSVKDFLNDFGLFIKNKQLVISGFTSYGTCSDACLISGAKECSGNGYRTCGDYNLDSCLEWSSVTSCNLNQICSNGNCICNPDWQCTSWTLCNNNQQTRTCSDLNNCGTISGKPLETQSCTSFQASSYGSCSDECAQNSRECSGNGYRICGNYDSDSCLEWGSVSPCIQNQICAGGLCSVVGGDVISNKCADGTNYSQCSTTRPKFCNTGTLINKCSDCGCPNNGQCQPDGSCISSPPRLQSTNLSLINEPPIFYFLPELIISKSQKNLNNLIELDKYSRDPENKKLEFNFEKKQKTFESDLITCFINDNIFGCNEPEREGSLRLIIFASDGIKDSSSQILLRILPIAGGDGLSAENRAPIANAGEDKVVSRGGQFILDASKSYDLDSNLPNLPSNYIWYENGEKIGNGINLKKTFSSGTHTITLQVIDISGLSSTDEVVISVESKDTCKDTNALYVPDDTICNKKWPSNEGKTVVINSRGYSCDLVEVCSENLDLIVEEAIDCCDGTPIIGNEARINSCSFANKYSTSNSKRCQALYLIQSLGGNSIYMKDYFEAEMCCRGVTELCNNQRNLYSARPLPNTGKDLTSLRCNNNPENNPPGEWISDSKLDLNNIALQDVPTHVSLNVLSTGTCVDYSFSLTTLLRKVGYKSDEIYTVEAYNHAYNLVKLPFDNKYTLVDTTGNNDPAIIFGHVPLGYDYCENIKTCYNDNGEALCPSFDNIYGCENAKQSIVKQGKVIGFRTNEIINKIVELVRVELER